MPSESVAERSLISPESSLDIEVNDGQGTHEETEAVVPKDGRLAWTVCAAGFTLQVLIVGMLHVFGVFFVEFIKEFKKTKGEIAWIGSAAYGLSMAFGPVTGMLVSRYGNRPVTMAGCFICALSSLTSSFAGNVETLFLTYSLMYGVGTSLAYTPTMTIAQDYFDRYVSVATGIMTAGSSTGTLVLAPLTQIVVDSYGWRVAFRYFAGTAFLTMFCAMLFRPVSKKQANPIQRIRKSPLNALMQELRLWKDRVFIVWVAGITLVMFGYYIPYVHLVSYANDVGVPPDQGSMLVMLLGGSTAVGRIMFGKIVQYGFLDRLHMHQLSMVITGTGAMLLPLISTFPGLAAYVVCVGLVDGCFVVLLPLLTAALVGSDRTVVAWGFLVGASSLTFTLGPPIAGWIYDYTGSYQIAFHVAGIPIVLGALVLFLVPWAQRTSTRSNVLQVVNVESPSDDATQPVILSPDTTPLSSPMCGTHPTSVPMNSSSRCFSISSTGSTKNISLTITGMLDKSYHPLEEDEVHTIDEGESSSRPNPCPRPRALSRVQKSAATTSSLPADLNLRHSTTRCYDQDAEASSPVNKKSSSTLKKEMFQKHKQLMLERGRIRAKSWSESGQVQRSPETRLPQETKSERNRDLISFDTRSQLTVDNTDRLRNDFGRVGYWRYRATSSSDMTQASTSSNVSSDQNYMADVSRQPSENSLVQMFDSFVVSPTNGRTLSTENSEGMLTGAENSEPFPTGPDTPISDTSSALRHVPLGNPTGYTQSPLIAPVGNGSEDESSTAGVKTASHLSQSSTSPLTSQEKLPTIQEDKTFDLTDSADGAVSDVGRISDAVSELVHIALLPSGGEG